MESLADSVRGLGELSIQKEYLQTEEFIDFFEAVLLQIIRTRNEKKVERFRDITLNKIINQHEVDYEERFVELVSQLDEKQILILAAHKKYKGETQQNFLASYPGKMPIDTDRDFQPAEYRTAEHYAMSKEEYMLFTQDLVSKALFYDEGLSRANLAPLVLLEITDFGHHFLAFLGIE